jgi:hypothetical protein
MGTRACSVDPWFPFALLLPCCHFTCQLAVCMISGWACIPHLVYLLPSPYHLTPGLWCRPHWAVQFAVCLVVAMVDVLVLEFMLDVHQSTPIYNVYQSA